jgi:hypothetical protein
LCFAWKEEDAKRKHLKHKCKSGKAKARAKSERVERELEGKFPPSFAYFSSQWFFFSLCFFNFA